MDRLWGVFLRISAGHFVGIISEHFVEMFLQLSSLLEVHEVAIEEIPGEIPGNLTL